MVCRGSYRLPVSAIHPASTKRLEYFTLTLHPLAVSLGPGILYFADDVDAARIGQLLVFLLALAILRNIIHFW